MMQSILQSDDLREVVAGATGGACATVIEYPLDTIKVRLQDGGKQYRNAWQCIRGIAMEEGIINGFFRGLPAPVLGAAVENAALFFLYRSFADMYDLLVHGTIYEPDTEGYAAVLTAGALGGIAVSQVLTPVDLIKCRMQIQNTLPVSERIYRNSLDCIQETWSRHGVRGFYRGHVAMMLREAIGCGLYFLAFQGTIRQFLEEGQVFHEASPAVHFLGGGLAGVAFWTGSYPIDAVKTKQQTMKVDYLKLNFRQCVSRLYKTEGMRGFFRGYGVTVFRALPGNAVLIAMYEQVNAAWARAEAAVGTGCRVVAH